MSNSPIDFTSLPKELIQMIISFLDIEDAKNMALTSKGLHSLTLQRLWRYPCYSELKDLYFLEKISQFPIGVLHTRDFDCTWLEVTSLVPQLKCLHVDKCGRFRDTAVDVSTSRLPFLKKIPLIVHTDAFKIKEEDDFQKFFDILKSINVKALFIDHESFDFDPTFQWSLEQFKMFAKNFKISMLYIDCLAINAGNVNEFIHAIAINKNCYIIFPELEGSYEFTIEDLELMVKLDLRVVKIESSRLDASNEIEHLLKFVEIIKKMRYLEEFQLSIDHFVLQDVMTMSRLVKLPIRFITSWNFHFEKGYIKDIANTLLQIKTLEEFRFITKNENPFKLSPKEFELFKDIPVTMIYLEQLDLTADNLLQFRKIMREKMKLKYIVCYGNFDFEVSVKSFGPGNIYKYI